MRKFIFSLLLGVLNIAITTAQVGISTTSPNAQLDIRSTNQATPANTDGVLIPKIDAFPVTNPTAAQQGMLVYRTTVLGTNPPSFYYWNNPTAAWIPILSGAANGALDQAYDFGGAGLGKTITADAGAVTIDGTDGLVSTGTFGAGALAPTGAGTKMFWNPRKGAFRAGRTGSVEWDDINIGNYSTAFGVSAVASGNQSAAFNQSTTASGIASAALGVGTTASGNGSIACGIQTIASGNGSTAFGEGASATGVGATAFGYSNSAAGNRSVVFGTFNYANGFGSTIFGQDNTADGDRSSILACGSSSESYGEIVMGIGATSYTPSLNGATQFRSANATDRLLIVGNAIDANSSNGVDSSERSDALIILKNGLTRLPSTTNAMITAADGKAVVTKEFLQSNTSGTLDQAYDFGGAGIGSTITADAGAVTIDGTDGLVSTGTFNSGAVMPAGADVKMVWNPRKGAFRAGRVNATEWDDANTGNYSASFGFNTTSSGTLSMAFGNDTTASGTNAFASGQTTIASATLSNAFGYVNTSRSYGETVFGIGATNYTGSANGATQFRTANATDRLFVVGNAIDANNNNLVDIAERSDALVILKNGRTGIGTDTPSGQFELSLNDGRKPGTNTWTIVSDRRLKTINGNYTKGLNDILQLNPIRFNYKNNGERKFEDAVLETEFPGFIAQEVQPLFPDAVGTDDDGFLNFNIHPILIASVNAFKELDAKNKQLTIENDALKSELNDQKEHIKSILLRLSALEKQ